MSCHVISNVHTKDQLIFHKIITNNVCYCNQISAFRLLKNHNYNTKDFD